MTETTAPPAAAPPPPAEAPAPSAPVRQVEQPTGAFPAIVAPDQVMLQAVQAATSLLKAHRTHGHLAAKLDPLGSEPEGDPALDPEPLGLTPEEFAKFIPQDMAFWAEAVRIAGVTLR